MSKPIGGARKSIKNQEGQGMLDIDENSSVEDDMFENVKTDEDMDHEMEEEEGGFGVRGRDRPRRERSTGAGSYSKKSDPVSK